MNKKGFTLIEVIVCIVLLGIIGTTTTVLTLKNTKKNEQTKISELNKKILEAAAVFTEIEKDENGNDYSKIILDGAKGVKIPLSYLVDKGYISEQNKKDVYSLNRLDESKNYYVMALNGSTEPDAATNNYCDNTGVEFTPSWFINSNKPIYLCNNYKKYETVVNVINNIQEINDNIRLKVNLEKNAVSQEYYDSVSEEKKANLTPNENGIFTLYDEENNKIYTYYRGAVDDNYLKLGLDADGNDLIWRILWYNDAGKMKLVLDNEIPIKIKNKLDEEIELKKGDTLIDFYKKGGDHYYILNSSTLVDERYQRLNNKDDYYYILNYDNERKLMKGFIEIYGGMTINDNIYFSELQKWFLSTNLNDYDFITTQSNFCKNNSYVDKSDGDEYYIYYPNNKFDCAYGVADKFRNLKYSYSNKSLFYSSSVGFLTYGDIVRAGIAENKEINVKNSGNFLLNGSSNSYVLSDLSQEYWFNESKGGKSISINLFYLENEGLKKGTFYNESRDSGSEDRYTYYSLQNDKNEIIYNSIGNFGKNGMIYKKTTFKANIIKPSIILDITDKKMSSDVTKIDREGTKNNPFELIQK